MERNDLNMELSDTLDTIRSWSSSPLTGESNHVTLAGQLESTLRVLEKPQPFKDEGVVIYTQAGEGRVRLKSRNVPCKEREAFLLPPNFPHEVIGSRHGWDILWFHFKGGFDLQALHLQTQEDWVPPVVCPASSLVPHLMHSIIGELKERRPHFQEGANAYARAVIVTLFRSLKPKRDTPESADDVLTRLTHYIGRNMDRPITVTELSEHLQMSQRHLHRVTKHYAGETPKQFVQRRKLARAMELLSNSDLTIDQISRRVGFVDPLYFSRVFRKYVSVTPSEFRKKAMTEPRNTTRLRSHHSKTGSRPTPSLNTVIENSQIHCSI